MAFFIFLHCAVAFLLMCTILMQSGKGGGLTEQFASAESIFGARTNIFMVRATSVLAGLFLLTSIVLAIYSSKENESLMNARAASRKMSHATGAAFPSGSSAVGLVNAEAQPSTPNAIEDTKTAPQPVNAGDAQKPQ